MRASHSSSNRQIQELPGSQILTYIRKQQPQERHQSSQDISQDNNIRNFSFINSSNNNNRTQKFSIMKNFSLIALLLVAIVAAVSAAPVADPQPAADPKPVAYYDDYGDYGYGGGYGGG